MPSTVRREAAEELSLLLSTSWAHVVPSTTWTGNSQRTACRHVSDEETEA